MARGVAWLILSLFLFTASPVMAQQQQEEDAPLLGNVARGMAIYQQRCANCHGVLGQGDGELAAQAVALPTALGSADYGRSAIPAAMFETIGNGRPQRGMPPFGEASSDPLSIQARWDVIAYLFALSTKSADLLSSEPPRTQLSWATNNQAAVALERQGQGIDVVSAEQQAAAWRMAFTEYWFADRLIVGTITNGTTKQFVAGQPLFVRAYEGFEEAGKWELFTDQNGSFQLSLPRVASEWVFRADTEFATVRYQSELFRFEEEMPSQVHAITVFDTSADSASLTLAQAQTFVESAPNQLYINHILSFTNDSNSVFVGGVPIELLPSAMEIRFEQLSGAGTFQPISAEQRDVDSFRIVEPLSPGNNSFLVRYAIPYTNQFTFAYPWPYPAQNNALFLPQGLTPSAEWQTPPTLELIDGQTFQRYAAPAQATFTLSLRGYPAFATDPESGNRIAVRNPARDFLIGGLALVGVVGIAFSLLWPRRTPSTQQSAELSQLLQQIAQLDDAFTQGHVKKAVYTQQRQQLWQRARSRWPTSSPKKL